MKRFIFVIVILAIVSLLSYYYYAEKPKPRDFITLYGNVDVRQVDLGFRVGGRVKEMFFEEGNVVLPGQLMALLETQPYADQLAQAEATVESYKTSLENANRLHKRRQELISDGSISQEDLDNALTSKNVYEANLKQAQAALGVAQSNLNFIELYSPAKGSILTRIREPGTVVRESDSIYTLSLTNPVWVRAYIAEPDLGLVYPDMKAEIYTDTPGGKVYQGHVGFISPVSEFTPKTVETTQLRTDLVYRLRIIADNPDEGLRQGMPVTVKLSLKQTNQ